MAFLWYLSKLVTLHAVVQIELQAVLLHAIGVIHRDRYRFLGKALDGFGNGTGRKCGIHHGRGQPQDRTDPNHDGNHSRKPQPAQAGS